MLKILYMKGKHLLLLLFSICNLSFLTSCSNDDDDEYVGNWVRVSDLDGKARANAATFVIGNKGYLTGGYDGEDYYNDLWEYDPDLNSWTQKADMPGVKRSSAVAFSSLTNGYVGTGYDGLNKLQDFWKYNPTSNSWAQIADFPGTGRYAAIGFGIDDKGYVGTGYDGSELKDFYKYDESSNSWSQIVSLGGTKRRDAAVFVIDKIAYVGFGSNNGSTVSDFWAFNPTTETWTRKEDTSNDGDDDEGSQDCTSPAAFAINGKGYIATGSVSGVSTVTWEYNPLTDFWTQKNNFEGSARESACAFSINNRGFVVSGNSGSQYFDDIWELKPNDELNEDD